MRKIKQIAVVMIVIISNSVYAQFSGGNHKSSSSVLAMNTVVSAPGSITLFPGFQTNGYDFHAFINNSVNCTPFSLAPSNDNYVLSYRFKQPNLSPASTGMSTCDVNAVIQYFDGLGRPMQSINIQGSPTSNDQIQPIAYDEYGRERFKYLPYSAASTGGTFRSGAVGTQASFYGSPPSGVTPVAGPYAETVFEASPLNRVLKQGAPGTSWQIASNNTAGMDYGANAANSVILFTASPGTLGYDRVLGVASSTYYGAGELYLTITTDENAYSGKTFPTHEYKDKEGRVVLKRVWTSGSTYLSTYYVYDDLGNLSFVLPPGANPDAGLPSQTLIDQFCYQYRYDGRKRMIEKWIPGKTHWEQFYYNILDQMVLNSDAGQVARGEGTAYKYDALGRLIMTGLMYYSHSRDYMQNWIDGAPALWETFDPNDPTGHEGYTNNAFPNIFDMVRQTVNYYDGYTFPGASSVGYSAITPSTMLKGLPTGTKTFLTDASASYLSATYYDNEGRVIQTVSQNHMSGNDIVTNTWNFAGELTASTRVHTGNSVSTTIANRYEYDHWGRKLNTFQTMNSDAEVLLSSNSYNETDQLINKSLHNSLQSTDYTYNERGWLKTSSSSQFSMELKYDNASNAQFNGNIAEQHYTNGSGNAFTYAYDALNRLTSGSATGMSESLTYDVMGNITSLNRNGAGASPYTYSGNRLSYITGGSITTPVSYTYDSNGNATTDGKLNVTITYNHLNLPTSVSNGLTYMYDARGNKLRKVSAPMSTTTDYVGGIQYINSSIEFIITEEGIARNNSGNYSYEYYLKDHLGNTRTTVYQDPNTNAIIPIQRDDYYPFGLRHVVAGGTNKYLYNGKELQDELVQYDYGARFYDPEIGRISTIDPLSEIARRWSPYSYGNNNPIRFIDVDGMYVDDYEIKENGEINVTRTNDKTNTYSYHRNDGTVENLGTYAKNESGLVDMRSGKQNLMVFNTSNTYLEGDFAASILGGVQSFKDNNGPIVNDPVQVNQLTNEQGLHSGHGGELGQYADIRYVNRSPNVNEPVWVGQSNYSEGLSQSLVNSFSQFGFNNRTSILTENSAGNGPALDNTYYARPPLGQSFTHQNHMHLQKLNKANFNISSGLFGKYRIPR